MKSIHICYLTLYILSVSILVLAQTPAVRLTFDTNTFVDATGGRTVVSSGHEYITTPFNGNKKGIRVTGGTNYAYLSPVYTLPAAWTITLWFKAPWPNSGDWQTLVRGSNSDHPVLLETGSGNLGMYDNTQFNFVACLNGGNGYNVPTIFSSRSDWSHLAAVGSGTTTTFYMNGTQIGVSSNKADDNIQALFGTHMGGQPWLTAGNYDFRVYGSALTQAQIVTVMNEATIDNTPPVVSGCPASFQSIGNRAVTWAAPTATDNSGTVNTVVTSSPVSGLTTSGTVFPIGNHTLTYVFTDPSSNKANCSFTINAIDCRSQVVTPSLRAATSGVIGTNLKIDILSSYGYNTTTITFNGVSNASCGNAAGIYWNDSASADTCGSLWTGVMPLNYALAQCAFNRDEAQTQTSVYAATLKITTTMLIGTFRGIPSLMRTIDTYVTVQLAFSTEINVTSTSLPIYGPALAFSRIISQTFNPNTYTATIILFTSSQFPYQLDSASFPTVSGFTTTIVPRTPDPSRSTAANCTFNSTCDQHWTLTISANNACNPGPSTLANSGWQVNFGVLCRTNFGGSCATPAPNTASVNFDTSSGNFCPTLISTQSSTATLTAYRTTSYTAGDITSEYVFGSRVYYQAVVTSFIDIEHLRIERVTIVSGAATNNLVVYQNTFTNAATYFSAAAPAGTYSNQPAPFATATFAQSPSLMLISENTTASGSLTRAVRFSWIWSGATSSAATDASVAAIVKVDLRIRYRNQSVVSMPSQHHDELLSVYVPHTKRVSANRIRILEDDSNLNAISTVSVTGASVGDNNNNNNSPIADDSSSSSSASQSVPTAMVAAGVAGAAIAAIAVLVIVAAVMKERAKNKQ